MPKYRVAGTLLMQKWERIEATVEAEDEEEAKEIFEALGDGEYEYSDFPGSDSEDSINFDAILEEIEEDE